MKSHFLVLLLILATINPLYINLSYNTPSSEIRISINATKEALKKWTFMVYMDADNNLESAAIEDFLEISSVGSTNYINVVVLLDRAEGYDTSYGDWTDARVFYVYPNEEPYDTNANISLGEVNMGDPDTLFWFVNWTIHNYPAERYYLVLWDHGAGWMGCCYDDSAGNDCLNASELEDVFSRIYNKLGIKIDIVGFDACLMAMVDVAFAIGNYAKFMVASEEYEPEDGWPYDDILSYLNSNYYAQTSEIANKTAYYYTLSYAYGSQGYDPYATQAVIDLTTFMEKVPEALSFFSRIALKNFDSYEDILRNASNKAEKFSCDYYCYVDLLNFTILVYDYAHSSSYLELEEASYHLAISLVNSIIASYYVEYHKYAYGLSVVLNETSNVHNYDRTPLSIRTLWDEFVMVLLNNPYSAWLYDAWIENYTDSDGDGFYEMITIGFDVDAYGSQEVDVTVILWNETTETVADITYTTTNNESDPRFVKVYFSSKASWNVEIRIQARYEEYVYDYVYNVTDDLFDIKGEPDAFEPTLIVHCEYNNSIISTNSITIEYEAYDNETYIAGVYIKIDDGEWISLDVAGKENITFNTDGLHVVYLKAVDANGNENIVVIKVIVDTTPPIISITSPKTGENVSTNFTLKWIASDNIGLDKIEIYIDGELYKVVDANTTQLTLSLTPGEHKIKLIAYDKAGHTSSAEITITVTSTSSNQENESAQQQAEDTTKYLMIVIVLVVLVAAVASTIMFVKRR